MVALDVLLTDFLLGFLVCVDTSLRILVFSLDRLELLKARVAGLVVFRAVLECVGSFALFFVNTVSAREAAGENLDLLVADGNELSDFERPL